MDAKEFFREQNRMLDSIKGEQRGECYIRNVGEYYCDNCPLIDNEGYCINSTEEAVDIVEKWSKENPKKTYLSVLLEAFPNTPMTNGEPVNLCPRNLGLNSPETCEYLSCKDCWNREYKEADND